MRKTWNVPAVEALELNATADYKPGCGSDGYWPNNSAKKKDCPPTTPPVES